MIGIYTRGRLFASVSTASIKILSPHRDDAAFSCGYLLTQLLQRDLSLTIENVFTRSSYAPYSPHHGDLEQVSQLRLLEDEAFGQMLSETAGRVCLWNNVGLLDAPDRLHVQTRSVLDGDLLAPPAYKAELDGLVSHLCLTPQNQLTLIPAGIGNHVDHRLTRDAAIEALPLDSLLLYQDLPYACTVKSSHPPISSPAIASRLNPVTVRRNRAADLKRRYSMCYASQIEPHTAGMMEEHGRQLDFGEVFYGTPLAHATLRKVLGLTDLLIHTA